MTVHTPGTASPTPKMIRDVLLVLVFAGWISIPGLGHLFGTSAGADVEEIEFRNAAPRPTMPHDADGWRRLPTEVDEYVNDHFGFREQMGRLHSTLLAAIGTSSSDRVLLGNDGWLYLVDENLLDEHRGTAPIPRRWTGRWVKHATAVHESLQRKGIAHVLTIIPSKWSIYPEHLPAWARKRGPTRYSRLAKQLSRQAQIPFVDASEVLLAEKAKGGSPLFWKTDTHWTWRGAFFTYRRIMAELELQRPGLKALTTADLRDDQVRTLASGDLNRFLNSCPIFAEPFTRTFQTYPSRHPLLAVRTVDGNRWRTASPREVSEKRWKTACFSRALNQATVLVYADSFANAMRDYLMQTFSEVVFVHHQAGVLDSDFIAAVNPDIVLVNLNERALRQVPRFVSRTPGLEPLRR